MRVTILMSEESRTSEVVQDSSHFVQNSDRIANYFAQNDEVRLFPDGLGEQNKHPTHSGGGLTYYNTPTPYAPPQSTPPKQKM